MDYIDTQLDRYDETVSNMDREELETTLIEKCNFTAFEIDGLFKLSANDIRAELVDIEAARLVGA